MTTARCHQRPLPTAVLPVPNESVPAYLGRLTRANGGTRRLHAHVDFSGPTDLEAWHDVSATASAFELATHLTGLPLEQLVKTLNVRLLPERADGRPHVAGTHVPRPLMPIERLRSCGVCTNNVPRLRLQPWTDPSAFICPIHKTLLTGIAAPVDDEILIAQIQLRRMWAYRNKARLRSAIEDAWTIVNGWTGTAGHLRVATTWERREDASGVRGRDALLLRTPEVVGVAFTLLAGDDDLHGTFERFTCQTLCARTTRRWLATATAR